MKKCLCPRCGKTISMLDIFTTPSSPDDPLITCRNIGCALFNITETLSKLTSIAHDPVEIMKYRFSAVRTQ